MFLPILVQYSNTFLFLVLLLGLPIFILDIGIANWSTNTNIPRIYHTANGLNIIGKLSVENHINAKHYLCINLRETFGNADCSLLCRIFSKATATTGLCFSWCEQAVREAATICSRPLQVHHWPLTLKVLSESRVTCAKLSKFSLPSPVCSRLRPDVHDTLDVVRRQTRIIA